MRGRKKSSYTCSSYHWVDQPNRTSVICDLGCMASWQSIDGNVSLITRQGCWNGRYKMRCRRSRCRYGHYGTHRTRTNVDLNMCCCHGDHCNDHLRSYIRPTTTSLPLPTTTVATDNASLADHAIMNPPGASSEIPAVPLMIGMLSLAFVLVICVFRRRADSLKDRLVKVKHATRRKTLKRPSTATGQPQNDESEDKLFCQLHSSQQCQVEVDEKAVLHRGKFGRTIYLAKATVNRKKTLVCYKADDGNAEDAEARRERLRRETRILAYLTRFDPSADRIVRLVASLARDPVALTTGYAMELCEKGSLRVYLDENTVDVGTCLSLVGDLSSALAFIHTPLARGKVSIAHRDVSSGNCLIRGNMRLVLSDFEFALPLNAEQQTDGVDEDQMPHTADLTQLTAAGTPFYVAPEIIQLTANLDDIGAALRQADVYSMSLVMWEIAERCHQFYDEGATPPPHFLPYQREVATTQQLINHVCEARRRPAFSHSSPDGSSTQGVEKEEEEKKNELIRRELCRTMEECWDGDEECRLSSSTVRDRIVSLQLHHCHPTRSGSQLFA